MNVRLGVPRCPGWSRRWVLFGHLVLQLQNRLRNPHAEDIIREDLLEWLRLRDCSTSHDRQTIGRAVVDDFGGRLNHFVSPRLGKRLRNSLGCTSFIENPTLAPALCIIHGTRFSCL